MSGSPGSGTGSFEVNEHSVTAHVSTRTSIVSYNYWTYPVSSSYTEMTAFSATYPIEHETIEVKAVDGTNQFEVSPSNLNEPWTLEITNNDAECKYETKIATGSGKQIIDIGSGTLPPGTYTAKVNYDKCAGSIAEASITIPGSCLVPSPTPTVTITPSPTPVCYPGTIIVGVHNPDGTQACCPEGAICNIGGGSPPPDPSPPGPTPSPIDITPSPSNGTPSPTPLSTPTITPIPTPTVTVTPKPNTKPSPEADVMIGIDLPIVSTTESESDDNAMISRLDNYFDSADRYALNNSFSTAAFSIKANSSKIDVNKYINSIKEKFYSLVSSNENKPLKTYHQITDKQVNIKHLVIIKNLSNKSKEAAIEGELNIVHNGLTYSTRYFNHTESVKPYETKRIVIQDPKGELNPNLVWYGRDELNKDYTYTDGSKGRFGPYLAENGVHTCTVKNTKVSPNFILEPPTDTSVYLNSFKIDSKYPEYVSNGVPKIFDTKAINHILERHDLTYFNSEQKDNFKLFFQQYYNSVQSTLLSNDNDKKKVRKIDTLISSLIKNRIFGQENTYQDGYIKKANNCFPASWNQNTIESAIKSIANLEQLEDTWIYPSVQGIPIIGNRNLNILTYSGPDSTRKSIIATGFPRKDGYDENQGTLFYLNSVFIGFNFSFDNSDTEGYINNMKILPRPNLSIFN